MTPREYYQPQEPISLDEVEGYYWRFRTGLEPISADQCDTGEEWESEYEEYQQELEDEQE